MSAVGFQGVGSPEQYGNGQNSSNTCLIAVEELLPYASLLKGAIENQERDLAATTTQMQQTANRMNERSDKMTDRELKIQELRARIAAKKAAEHVPS